MHPFSHAIFLDFPAVKLRTHDVDVNGQTGTTRYHELAGIEAIHVAILRRMPGAIPYSCASTETKRFLFTVVNQLINSIY